MKPMKTLTIALLAASVAGSAVTAYAAGGQGGWGGAPDNMPIVKVSGKERGFDHKGRKGGKRDGKKLFEEFDTNKDGVITQAEVDAAMVARFGKADANGDGKIDLSEFKTSFLEHTTPKKVRAFQRLDADGDGTVTKAEFDHMTDGMFKMLDRDGNDELTLRGPHGFGKDRPGKDRPGMDRPGKGAGKDAQADDDAARGPGKGADADKAAKSGKDMKKPERMARRGDGDGPMMGGHMMGGHMRDGMRGPMGPGGFHGPMGGPKKGGMPDPKALFDLFDADMDGKITKAEFETKRDALFASAAGDAGTGFELAGFDAIWMTLHQDKVVRMFQHEDANGDLGISQEEFTKRSADMVEHMDRNGDGVITKADFQRGKKHGFDRDGRRGGDRDHGPKMGRDGGHGWGHGSDRGDDDHGPRFPRGERD